MSHHSGIQNPEKSRRGTVRSLVALVVVETIALVGVWVYEPEGAFDRRTVPPNGDFAFADTITCEIVYSTWSPGEGLRIPYLDISEFTLTGLESDAPVGIQANREWDQEYAKEYEISDYVVLRSIPPSHGTDTISIMKENGNFVRVLTGQQAGQWRFHYAVALVSDNYTSPLATIRLPHSP